MFSPSSSILFLVNRRVFNFMHSFIVHNLITVWMFVHGEEEMINQINNDIVLYDNIYVYAIFLAKFITST